VRRKSGELYSPGGEELVSTDENCVGSLLLQTCEGHINIPDCTSVNDLHLPSNIRSSGVSLSDQRLGNCTVWINERGDTLGFGDEFMEESEPLCA